MPAHVDEDALRALESEAQDLAERTDGLIYQAGERGRRELMAARSKLRKVAAHYRRVMDEQSKG